MLSASWVMTVVAMRSTNLFVFWRRSTFESVSRPAARNAEVLTPRSFVRDAAFISPVMSTQSLPPVGSGWMTPVFTSEASARVTTSNMVRVAGDTVIAGDQKSSPTTAKRRIIQKIRTFGWKRSGGTFLSCRRGFLVSRSGIYLKVI